MIQRIATDQFLQSSLQPPDENVSPKKDGIQHDYADHRYEVKCPIDAEGMKHEIQTVREQHDGDETGPEYLPQNRLNGPELPAAKMEESEVRHPEREEDGDDLDSDHADILQSSMSMKIRIPSNTVVPLYLSW